MAKGNLFLGQARGSVGSVTFTVLDGKQVAKARNRQPRNPRAVSQMVSRIILNTVSKAYSRMQAICDHAFESRSGASRNQQRFNQLNIAMLRDRLYLVIENPTEQQALDNTEFSFSFKDDFNMSVNEYYVSEGTLSPVNVDTFTDPSPALKIVFGDIAAATPTYQDIVDALGCQRGDQLTFLGLGHDYQNEFNYDQADSFEFARVILEPASGDMSTPFMLSQGVINDPNPKNEGNASLELVNNSVTDKVNGISFGFFSDDPAVNPLMMVAGTVILSRFENNKWRRSPQRLIYTSYASGEHLLCNATFGAAYASYLQGENSGLYLNGSPTAAAAVPSTAASISTAKVHGDNWPAAGQTREMHEASEQLFIVGEGLSDETLKVMGSNGAQTLTFVGSTAATVLLLSSYATYTIRLNGVQWGGSVISEE